MENNIKRINVKVSQTKIVDTINVETGEIYQSIQTKVYGQDKEPNYIKMYIEDIARLNELPIGMNKILIELIKSMGYNNVIPCYKPIKLMICNRLGIGLDYLNKAIDMFNKKGILIRYQRGIYIADPSLFAKGRWEDIKNLRLIIDYNKDGTKSIKSSVNDEMEQLLSSGISNIE